jgi:hypothetical protein
VTAHECRRARRCKTRTRDAENQWRGGGVETPGLCAACEESAFDAIRQLGEDWHNLDAALTVKQKRGIPQYGGTNERPSPLNLGVAVVSADLETEALRWYRAVATESDDELPWHYLAAVDRALTMLCTRLGTLIDKPVRRYDVLLPLPFGGDHMGAEEWDGVDGVLRLAQLHHDAQKVLGTTETRIWLPDPCHVCGVKTLAVSRDQQTIRCRGCRNVWDAHQFAALQEKFDYERRDVRA